MQEDNKAIKSRVRYLEREMNTARGMIQRQTELEPEIEAIKRGQSVGLWSQKPEADRIVRENRARVVQ